MGCRGSASTVAGDVYSSALLASCAESENNTLQCVEIDSIVADGAQSLIREQVEMGVAVRMAVLEALARNLPNA